MRISYWSSDVCSSDLIRPRFLLDRHSIQYDLPIAYFYCVAGQADNTLDVIAALTPGRDYDDVSALGQTAQQPTFYRGQNMERSEEHTSELQSLMRISYAVFCLKKKNNNKNYNQ